MPSFIPEILASDPSLEGAFMKPSARRPVLPFSLYPAGIPAGALTHLSGLRCTEVFLRLLAEQPRCKAAWVEERVTAYPPAFVQQGVDLNCLLFVEGGKHFAWALTELVRSQCFKLINVASPIQGELELRRLQLAAERSGTTVILSAPYRGPAWPLRLILESRVEEGELGLYLLEKQFEVAV